MSGKQFFLCWVFVVCYGIYTFQVYIKGLCVGIWGGERIGRWKVIP